MMFRERIEKIAKATPDATKMGAKPRYWAMNPAVRTEANSAILVGT